MNPELTDKQQNTDICLIKNAYKLSLPLSRPLPVRGHLPRPLLLPLYRHGGLVDLYGWLILVLPFPLRPGHCVVIDFVFDFMFPLPLL